MLASNPTSQCSKIVRHTRVSVSERGKSVTFLNPIKDNYCVLQVDGCAITEGPRSDYIISKVGELSVIIELKGKDVEHAVDQLFSTVANVRVSAYLENARKLLIVCAKYPSFDTKIAKAQVRAKKLGMTLKIVCRSFECDIGQI